MKAMKRVWRWLRAKFRRRTDLEGIVVDPETFARIEELVQNPPPPGPKLREAARRHNLGRHSSQKPSRRRPEPGPYVPTPSTGEGDTAALAAAAELLVEAVFESGSGESDSGPAATTPEPDVEPGGGDFGGGGASSGW